MWVPASSRMAARAPVLRRLEQEVPLRQRQFRHRFAVDRLAVDAHLERLGVDLNIRDGVIELQILLTDATAVAHRKHLPFETEPAGDVVVMGGLRDECGA